MLIRPYERRDRQALRTIACDTADLGRPIERFFPDRDVAADLLMRYYTDYEPQAAWIAEHDGRVVGYLTGCLDTRRYQRIMARRLMPALIAKAIRRGVLWSSSTWRLAAAGWRTLRRGGLHRDIPLDRYPAHLHINVQEGFRGQHIGAQLMGAFFIQARQAGLPGVHVCVRGDNQAACAFFAHEGFVPLSRHPIVAYDGTIYQSRETVVYGKPL